VARKIVEFQKRATIFAQGTPAKHVMYIQQGGVKLTVVNDSGKEAVVAIPGPGEFLGEGCLTAQPIRTATAIVPTTVLVIKQTEMMQALHARHEFSDRFIAYILNWKIRIESDLVDQFLTRPRNGWLAHCFCSLDMESRTNPNICYRKYLRKLSRRRSAQHGPGSISS
jgi:CRP-like cAMP-binding protein